MLRILDTRYVKVMALCVVLALASCGGGGGGSGSSTGGGVTPISYGKSIAFEAQCAAPRIGTDPYNNNQPYPDKAGSLDIEKSWLRAWTDETYLWNTEVGNLNAALYSSPVAYFNALKTTATTASGRFKDQFHFTYDTAAWEAFSQSGSVGYGYGIEWTRSNSTAPNRIWQVLFTEPGSPAANAGIQRGDLLQTVDGADFVNGNNTAVLNAGLNPVSAGETHSFTLTTNTGTIRSVQMASSNIATQPVQNVNVISTATGKVGYMLFNDHIATAEGLLVNAIDTFKAAGISDLVIDLRYNGGGSLAIASELAYMIAGPTPTTGKAFETFVCNSKNPFPSLCSLTYPFLSKAPGYFGLPVNQVLPYLGLTRVYVLTSFGTASASESIINSLRGVDVKVNIIGSATRGKPYGFYPTDNCGTTYFTIQFKGANAKGFGDYSDGFLPTCQVADDLTHALGDPLEGRLSAALSYRASRDTLCVPPTSIVRGLSKEALSAVADPVQDKPLYRTGKIMR
jgi:carboxyl-terminal processing protease